MRELQLGAGVVLLCCVRLADAEFSLQSNFDAWACGHTAKGVMSSSDFRPILRDSRGGLERRPVGVTIAAILLGLLACVVFLLASFMLAAVVHRSPTVHFSATATAMKVSTMVMLFVASSLAMFVVVGLFRMRRWARFGILIFGALMAVWYGVLAIRVGAASVSHPTLSVDSSPSAMTQFALALIERHLLMTLIGVWWLVYFNLPRVRQVFAVRALGPRLSDNAFRSPAETLPPEEGR